MADNFKFTFLDDNGDPIPEGVGTEEQEQEEQEQQEQQDNSSEDNEQSGEAEGGDGEGEDTQTPDQPDDSEGDDQADDSVESGAEDQLEEEQGEEEIVDYDELPEVVQKFLDFVEETNGRGTMEDFLLINQDLSKISEDEAIRRFLKVQNPYLDDEDIALDMEEQFGFDPDVDDDKDIRKKKVAKKKLYGQAMQYLQEQQSKHKVDLASREPSLPKDVQEAVQFKKQYSEQAALEQKQYETNRKRFLSETNKVLGKDFKGFEVKVGDSTHVYKPEDVKQLREQNLDVNKFLGRFIDPKTGEIKDVAGYHKALAFASNPDAVAQHFIEIGKALAIEEETKSSKNIKTEARKTQSNPKPRNAPKFKFLDDDSKNKGKISLQDY